MARENLTELCTLTRFIIISIIAIFQDGIVMLLQGHPN